MYDLKQIALTIDDLPFVAKYMNEGIEITDLLLRHLRENKVKATGFVIGKRVEQEEEVAERLKLLEKWYSDGHLLANHTYSHLPFSEQSLEDFEKDVIRNEKILAPFLEAHPEKYFYFRFPHMDYGNTAEQTNKAYDFLHKRSYTITPISLDAKDYIFNTLYTHGDEGALDQYIEYFKAVVKFREQQAMRFTSKRLGLIMLIHANWINAVCLSKIITFLKQQGYEFVSLQEVLNEPVYLQGDALINFERYLSWESRSADGKYVQISYPTVDLSTLEAYNRCVTEKSRL
jgi:peptidoglycan/xylan/chitin deacetylase (PgdA/CDA1 family)